LNSKAAASLFLTALLILIILATPITPTARAEEYILRIPTDCPPRTFNPLQAATDICQTVWFSGLLYETLILKTFNDSLVPWLAKSWEILDNGTRYVFHLDERAKWSDGKPVTAKDVEFTWKLIMQYAFPSILQGILQEVRAVDNYTVEFITTKPWFRWDVDFGISIVLPSHIWSELTDPLGYDFIDDPSKHITSGPFIYDSYKPGEWWLFKKRPDYWKTESIPKIDGVLLRFVADFSLYPFLLLKDEVDIAELPFYLLPQVVGKPNIEIWINPVHRNQEILFINTRIYPLNIKEVRLAIELAIDKVEIANFYFMGYGVPANRTLWDFTTWREVYVPEAVWPGWGKTKEERIAEANRILDELGFHRGPDGVRVTPNGTRLSFKFLVEMVPLTAVRLRVAEAISSYLREIGIEISSFQPLMIPDFFAAVFFAEEGKRDYGFAAFTDGEISNIWSDLGWFLMPIRGINYLAATGWHITAPEAAERVNELVRRAFESLSYEEMVECIKEIVKIQAEHLPLITIVHYPLWIWAYRTNRFTNWNFDVVTRWTGGGGFRIPWRPLAVQELTPVGWKPPTAPPTTPPTAPPTTPPTAPPTTPPTAPPTTPPTAPPEAPAAPTIPIEQIITIVVIVVIIAVAAGYFAVRAKRKAK